MIPDDTPVEDCPLGMMRNALRRAGYATAGDLRVATDAQLMMKPGIGRGTVNKIRLVLGRNRVARINPWNEALEAAALEADKQAALSRANVEKNKNIPMATLWPEGCVQAAEQIAAAIRALKRP